MRRMAEATGLGGLATFSRGFGDERYVSVMREGSQPSRVRPDLPCRLLNVPPCRQLPLCDTWHLPQLHEQDARP